MFDIANMNFYFGVMGRAKSATLLIQQYNEKEKGMSPLLLKSSKDDRDGVQYISSRIEKLKEEAIPVTKYTNIYKLVQDKLENNIKITSIYYDEIQFDSKENLYQLRKIANDFDIEVNVFGLKSDFLTDPFEGSIFAFVLSDNMTELPSKCSCGNKANFNLRLDENNKPIFNGNKIQVGKSYIGVCPTCYFKMLKDSRKESKSNE